MNEQLLALVGILDEMTSLHDRLAELGNEKSVALAASVTDDLSAITNRETKYVQKLTELERERVLAVARVLYASGLTATPSFRLEQLIQMVYKAEEKRLLAEAAARLRKSVERLQEVNRFNQQLLKVNLDYVQLSLDLVTGPFEEEATYHRSIQDQSFKRSSHFDTKA